MGFIMGPAFGVFYIFAGIPLGRLADVMSRRWLIFIGQIFWSTMSAGCGLIRTFPAFLALRMGLGVGEATLSPAAYSSITDLFPRHKLGRALSVYGLGISIGAGVAWLVGGVIVGLVEGRDNWVLPIIEREIYPWQIVFFFIAAPTIPLSILLLTIREPKRRGLSTGGGAGAAVPLRESLAYIWENRATMGGLSFGLAFLSFSGYGTGAWLPSHFIRNLGWTASEVGVYLGLSNIAAGASGMIFGGWLADRLHTRGVVTSKLTVAMISAVAWFPFGILYPLMNEGRLTILFYAPGGLHRFHALGCRACRGAGDHAESHAGPGVGDLPVHRQPPGPRLRPLHHGDLHAVRLPGRHRRALVDPGRARRRPRTVGAPAVGRSAIVPRLGRAPRALGSRARSLSRGGW